jgi:hypothetical protein
MNEGVDILDFLDRAWAWVNRLVPVLDIDAANVLTLIKIAWGLLALFCVGLLIREVATHFELAPHRRARYLVRSIPHTRWSTEELERWAAQLSMSRRRVRSHIDRPAHAVRIRLAARPNGPQYTIEGSRRLAPIMRNPVLPGLSVTPLRPRGGHRRAPRS